MTAWSDTKYYSSREEASENNIYKFAAQQPGQELRNSLLNTLSEKVFQFNL